MIKIFTNTKNKILLGNVYLQNISVDFPVIPPSHSSYNNHCLHWFKVPLAPNIYYIFISFLAHRCNNTGRYLKMTDEGGTSKFQPKKKKKYLIAFKTRQDKWSVDYPFLKTSKRGENYTHCAICNSDFCIGNGGENDVKRHITLNKHIEAFLR